MFGLVWLLAAASCAPKQKDISDLKVPENIIPPDSMVVLIADLQLAESALREFKRLGRESKERNVAMIENIFEKHHTTPERFDASKKYYDQHLELYQQIYEQVIVLLTRRQTEILNEDKKKR